MLHWTRSGSIKSRVVPSIVRRYTFGSRLARPELLDQLVRFNLTSSHFFHLENKYWFWMPAAASLKTYLFTVQNSSCSFHRASELTMQLVINVRLRQHHLVISFMSTLATVDGPTVRFAMTVVSSSIVVVRPFRPLVKQTPVAVTAFVVTQIWRRYCTIFIILEG